MNTVAKGIQLAVVAIGRNEGDRLKTCLGSVLASGVASAVVYVDSGSTDGSASFARSLGCEVVDLDMSVPFTAARARNEGWAHAVRCIPKLTHIQFVDGDCELIAGWLTSALSFLDQHQDVAAVCGRTSERYPQRSIYNQLCDIEWSAPVGEAKSCGGNALLRADALLAAGGYRASLIAGEEPELCVRLRASGWRVWRLDQAMVLHDANMMHFGQWWTRSKRAGYAFAEGAALHGAPPERHWVRESRSVWLWGAGVPTMTVVMLTLFGSWALVFILVYPLQILRIYLRSRLSVPRAGWYATFLVLGKLPAVLGQFKFIVNRLQGKRAALIEYK